MSTLVLSCSDPATAPASTASTSGGSANAKGGSAGVPNLVSGGMTGTGLGGSSSGIGGSTLAAGGSSGGFNSSGGSLPQTGGVSGAQVTTGGISSGGATGTGGTSTAGATSNNAGAGGGAAGANSGGSAGSAGGPAADPNFGTEGDGQFEINAPFSLPAESQRLNSGVSAGKVEQFTWAQSPIFPNTSRVVRVYVPVNYTSGEPAALMVLQDGSSYVNAFRMPTVLDNLIASGAVPLQVAVFIDAAAGANRSSEYDCLNDNYFRFVTEEILPEVERRYGVRFSTDPWKRGIGGHSSGGSAAFTAGFRHPESFRRILTHSGSFTNLCRAGSDSAHTYPALIRAADPKPLRVFLLTGTDDNGAGTGGNNDWVKMNRDMAAALQEKAYHTRFVFANGGSHAQISGASVLPDTLRWLWRG